MKNTGRTAALAAALTATATIATAALAAPAIAISRPSGPHESTTRAHGSLGSSQALAGATTFTTPAACTSGQTYTVPDGVFALKVQAVGGHGAAGVESGSTQSAGGLGGVVTTTIPVRPGQALRVQVGGNGSTASNGGAGGVGGGGSGGSSKSGGAHGGAGQAGGGGGFSGIASADCNTWYAIAGGGGGGAAGTTGVRSSTDHMNGGHGGDACPLAGASCTAAGDGPSAWAGSGHGGTPAPAAGGGSGGSVGAGPTGHTGGRGGNAPATNLSVGGGGGGGGGYWAGGGGGSGTKVGGAGGGGAGGTSWTMGFPGSNLTTATPGQPASVTVTPVSDDVVIQSADNGQVLNIFNGATDDGTQIIQWPRVNGAWNETWNLVPFDGPAYQIQNPQTGKCLTVGGANVGSYSGVMLSTCTGAKVQVWQVDWESDGTARIYNPAGDLSIAGSATGVPVDVAPSVTDPSHRWSIIATGWPAGS